MKITCPGDPGHGSRFIENTAASKFRYLIDRFLDLREQEKNKLEANPHFTLGDVTSVNLTKVEVCEPIYDSIFRTFNYLTVSMANLMQVE